MNWSRVFMATAAMSLCVSAAFAEPLDPTPYVYDNQGDALTLQDIGDEHYNRTLTGDGYVVIRDSLGVYYFAGADGRASTFKARDPAARNAQETMFLGTLDKKKVKEEHFRRHAKIFNRPVIEKEGPAPWANLAQESSDNPPVLRLPRPNGHAKGTNRFMVLMVSNDTEEDIDSLSFWHMLNDEGYATDGYVGSVRDYFTDQSLGKFVPSFDMYSVKVQKSFASYVDIEYRLIRDATEALLAKYPNFDPSVYDADNDGDVDAIAVLYAGTRASASKLGGFKDELSYLTGGRVSVGGGKYFNIFFLLAQKDHLYPSFIHEFSHTLGLKDHYCVRSSDCYDDFTNSVYQAPGAHAWDVMATGMYNGSQKNPAGYSAFERAFMGWMDYETMDMSADVLALDPLPSSNRAYKIPVPNRADEWFILENRQKNNKWDAKLPGHGMLIWHIDYNSYVWERDAMNDDVARQRIDVVEAGDQKITSYSDGYHGYHQSDDPFPGSQKVTEFYGFKSWSGVELGVNLYGIMEEKNRVCFTTKSDVKVTTCDILIASSSSVIKSSSSVAKSSSSVAKSSSSVASSSSVVKSSASVAKSSSSVAKSSASVVAKSSSSVVAKSSASDAKSSSSAAKSSSSVAKSSASAVKSSAGEEQSSSSLEQESSSSEIDSSASETESSSSAEELGVIPAIAKSGVEFHLDNSHLEIVVSDNGRKTISIFDMLGNKLLTADFHGTRYTVSLKPFAGRALVVRISENGKLLKMNRIAL